MLFAGNFAPVGYLPCDGRLVNIADNDALYMLLGTTYGGDGQVTFGLPDLRGRVPQHFGNGLGLRPVALGQMSGTEANTLTSAQMPAHSHTFGATVSPACNSTDEESSPSPIGCFLAKTSGTNSYSTTQNGQTGPSSFTMQLSASGSGMPIDNIQPMLAMTYCIANSGIFPPQPY